MPAKSGRDMGGKSRSTDIPKTTTTRSQKAGLQVRVFLLRAEASAVSETKCSTYLYNSFPSVVYIVS